MLNLENLIYLLLFFLTAVMWFELDRKWGIPLYHFFDRWTSEDCKAEKKEVGFITGQKGKFRFAVALVLAAVQTYFFYHGAPFIHKVVMFLAQTIVLFAGFYLGPWAHRTWKAKDKVFEIVDKVEDGTIDIAEEAKHMAETATDHVKHYSTHAMEKISKAAEQAGDSIVELTIRKEPPASANLGSGAAKEEKKEQEPASMADFIEKHRKQ
jgi:hypothetical protein